MSEGFEFGGEVVPCDECGKKLRQLPIITCRVLDREGLHMFDFCSKECLIEYFGETD